MIKLNFSAILYVGTIIQLKIQKKYIFSSDTLDKNDLQKDSVSVRSAI